jgi:hypothetical protein
MSSLKINQKRISFIEDEKLLSDYLESKYGKEPKITDEELKEIRWNWH